MGMKLVFDSGESVRHLQSKGFCEGEILGHHHRMVGEVASEDTYNTLQEILGPTEQGLN